MSDEKIVEPIIMPGDVKVFAENDAVRELIARENVPGLVLVDAPKSSAYPLRPRPRGIGPLALVSLAASMGIRLPYTDHRPPLLFEPVDEQTREQAQAAIQRNDAKWARKAERRLAQQVRLETLAKERKDAAQ